VKPASFEKDTMAFVKQECVDIQPTRLYKWLHLENEKKSPSLFFFTFFLTDRLIVKVSGVGKKRKWWNKGNLY